MHKKIRDSVVQLDLLGLIARLPSVAGALFCVEDFNIGQDNSAIPLFLTNNFATFLILRGASYRIANYRNRKPHKMCSQNQFQKYIFKLVFKTYFKHNLQTKRNPP
jgi:hypothetical protein